MLTIDPVVKINLSINAAAVASENFYEIGAILGTTNGVITAEERYKKFGSLDAVASAGYSSNSPEYLAAQKYFGVSPVPTYLVVVYYQTSLEAPEYSATSTYDVGDLVTHESTIYKCIAEIETAEQWTAAHWAEVEFTPETPVGALADAISKGASFYGVYLCPGAADTDATMLPKLTLIDEYLNNIEHGMQFYGVLGTADDELGTGAGKAFDYFFSKKSRRAIGMLCAAGGANGVGGMDDAAGLMGVAMGYAHAYSNSNFALAYKPIASAEVRGLTQAEINAVEQLNGNVYVQRMSYFSFELGATAHGMRFDEVLYLDRIAHDLEAACFGLIAGSDTKLPQTDSTTEQFLTVVNSVLNEYSGRGVLQTSVWNGGPLGGVATGDTIEGGYISFADSYADQSPEDRAARKSVPITVLLCMNGAVESIVVNLSVQE